MDYDSLASSGIFGGLIGLASYALIDKIIGKRFNWSTGTKSIVSLVITISTTTVFSAYKSSLRKRESLVQQMEQGFAEANQIIPIFDLISSLDPERFQTFKRQLESYIMEHPGVSQQELDLKARELGGQLSASYYKRASDDAMLKYSEAYANFLFELAKTNPETLCRWQIPHVFGTLTLEDWRRTPDKEKWYGALRAAIQSGARGENSKPNSAGGIFYSDFQSAFSKQYPNEHSVINNPVAYRSAEGFPIVAKAVARYYSEINRLPKVERLALWRYTLGGPE